MHYLRQAILRVIHLGISWAILLVCASRALPQNLAEIVAGNKTSIEMIHSYYAEIRLEDIFQGKPYSRTAKYWRERRRVRWQEIRNPETVDIEIVGDRSVAIPTWNGKTKLDPHVTGAVIGNKNRRPDVFFPWDHSLFALPAGVQPTPPLITYSLPEAVEKGRIKTVEWSQLSGRRAAYLNIELSPDPAVRGYEVWVEPGRNWLVTKCIHHLHPADGEPLFKMEYQVEDWAEPSPTIFVPTKVARKWWQNGKLLNETKVYRMIDVRVNSPLPPCPAMPSLPAGTLVYDELQGGMYQIDGTGKRMGAFTPAKEYIAPASATDALAPSRSYVLLGILFVGAASVLVSLGVWKRKRRAA
jgi:hypothetical protein